VANVNDKLSTIPIVALDVPTVAEALELVDHLGDRCRFYKIGSELFTACGPSIVHDVKARGCDVFLDLKFHDIPNTVAGGVRRAAGLGVRLVTVHASGGRAILEAAVRAAGDSCHVLAVTVLTSLTDAELAESWGRQSLSVTDEVLRLAEMAASADVHGVVCSGREAPLVRDRFGSKLATLVPGVRAAGSAVQDQARVVTARDAAAAGARYAVIGRMVTAATDRRGAMDTVLGELACP
jgi:orotidine-5'-phosphate decarboxylase